MTFILKRCSYVYCLMILTWLCCQTHTFRQPQPNWLRSFVTNPTSHCSATFSSRASISHDASGSCWTASLYSTVQHCTANHQSTTPGGDRQPLCSCGQLQMMSHIVDVCPSTEFPVQCWWRCCWVAWTVAAYGYAKKKSHTLILLLSLIMSNSEPLRTEVTSGWLLDRMQNHAGHAIAFNTILHFVTRWP